MKSEITIYLGSKCNLNCPYCHKENSENESSVSEELLQSLKNKECTIYFKGGEPTLYIDQIKKIVKAANWAKFEITTNGVLLEKYQEYFKEHNFTVNISYDGNNNTVRKYDPLNKKIDYDNIKISCTLYHNNADLKNIINNFLEKSITTGKYLPLFPHIIHCTNKQNKKYALNDEEFNNIFIQYKELLNEYLADYLKYNILNRKYKSLYMGLKSKLNRKFIFGETMCANRNNIRINCSGEQYNCLYIRDTVLSKDNWLNKQKALIRQKNSKCEFCDVYDICGSGCIKSIFHSQECNFYYSLYSWFKKFYNENKEIFDKMDGCDNVSE